MPSSNEIPQSQDNNNYSEDVELQTFGLKNSKSTTSMTDMDESTPSSENFDVGNAGYESDSSSTFEFLDTDSRLKKTKLKIARFFRKLWNGPKIVADEPTYFKNQYVQQFEAFPERISKSFPMKIKLPFILMYYAFWLWFLRQALLPYLTETSSYKDSTTNDDIDIINVSCRDESSIWKGKNSACGLNAEKCGPFEGDREVIFRCPALCDSESITYSSLTVGDQYVKYRSFYVGGGKLSTVAEGEIDDDKLLSYPYRADSYPCGAAIHAGVISPFFGGCARVKFTGSQMSFNSTPSQYDTDISIPFDTFFPASYTFVKTPKSCKNCYDPRTIIAVSNILLGLPVVFMSLNGQFAFWTSCISGFWTILLSFDPPRVVKVQDPESLPTLFSLGFERFLPMCFILVTIWKISCGNTLGYPSSAICKTLIWYPLFWVGILNNVTFDRLPVDRLTITDIMTQPGSLLATSFIVVLITSCAVIQAYQLWKAGKFRRYLGIYLTFIFGLIILANLKGLNLRIHHYVLALLLIPGTNTKGFTAILFQGVLLGLLVNGVARWGLASVEETDRSLRRSDPSGEITPPSFLGYLSSNHSISWHTTDTDQPTMIDGEFISPHDSLDKYSLLVNDVEVYNGYNTSVNIAKLTEMNKEFGNLLKEALEFKENVNLYLRLSRSGKSNKRSDYTKAATLVYPKGEFKLPESGLT